MYPFTATTNRVSFKRDYHEDRAQPYPLRMFVRGYRYKLLFVFESDIHLFGTGVPEVPVHLLGTDHLGRDMLARVMYGAQISLSVGLVGVAISFILGILIGGLAGYFGGFVDEAVQRVVEVLLSIPQLPLWMGLSAALPLSWPVVRMYFAITVILSLVGWTRLAREVRGKFPCRCARRTTWWAAQVSGMRDLPIILRHMVPSFLSHIVASLTLSIPLMIIGETSLSFLGLGMQAPAISWGVLLQSAQKVQTLELAPLVDDPGPVRDRDRARLQLPRRRPPRRRRPLRPNLTGIGAHPVPPPFFVVV